MKQLIVNTLTTLFLGSCLIAHAEAKDKPTLLTIAEQFANGGEIASYQKMTGIQWLSHTGDKQNWIGSFDVNTKDIQMRVQIPASGQAPARLFFASNDIAQYRVTPLLKKNLPGAKFRIMADRCVHADHSVTPKVWTEIKLPSGKTVYLTHLLDGVASMKDKTTENGDFFEMALTRPIDSRLQPTCKDETTN
ncbi:hypothetical protein LIN78_04545 [Leeia sp. TBRC 13508]|uniref:Uncharacterized protein n=1 Tax=Leeia speluncae TaxID=2884804 RepID=A0ABS8D489_9NEIS|nr:hypothetical protein [Leeia speluncae]MCB6182818.1 hypothetical protein [Leeia speluncae]